jgi:signal transduction histidine kinase
MERTVTNLLTLAHLDAGNEVVKIESVNLFHLVDGIWKRLQDEAGKRRITLDCRIPVEIEIKSDRVKLNLILMNIISNAVSYGAEGSKITVDTVESGGMVRLSVTNIATDLTEQDLEVMLERFWRKDQSRTGTRHAGLGLSLVKELAAVLNLQVKSLLDDGSRFTLSLYGLARV